MKQDKNQRIGDEMNFLQDIAKAIDNSLISLSGRKLGFALLVFELGNPGIGNYVSNAERESMIKALRETADRLELGQEIPKTIGPAQ